MQEQALSLIIHKSPQQGVWSALKEAEKIRHFMSEATIRQQIKEVWKAFKRKLQPSQEAFYIPPKAKYGHSIGIPDAKIEEVTQEAISKKWIKAVYQETPSTQRTTYLNPRGINTIRFYTEKDLDRGKPISFEAVEVRHHESDIGITMAMQHDRFKQDFAKAHSVLHFEDIPMQSIDAGSSKEKGYRLIP